MSDEENVMENVEQHADEADNTDHSNKRRHDQEEETVEQVESKKKKCLYSQRFEPKTSNGSYHLNWQTFFRKGARIILVRRSWRVS